MSDLPPPPADLTERSKLVWSDVLQGFELTAAELEVLRQALVSLDRADQAAAIVSEEGCVTTDRYGSPKAHPAVDVEARSRAIFARLISQLGVKFTVDAATGRRNSVATSRGM